MRKTTESKESTAPLKSSQSDEPTIAKTSEENLTTTPSSADEPSKEPSNLRSSSTADQQTPASSTPPSADSSAMKSNSFSTASPSFQNSTTASATASAPAPVASTPSQANLPKPMNKDGYLFKVGGKNIKGKWQKRWFALSKDNLCYAKSSSSKILGSVELSAVKDLLVDATLKPFSFAVVTVPRTYYLYASSDPERAAWLDALKTNVQLQRATNPNANPS